MIGRLQRALDEKTRGERGERGDRGERPRERPGAGPQDDVLKRLDRLSQEIEELRRSLRK
jgi:hypothetical protein